MDVQIMTAGSPWKKGYAANTTSTLATPIPTITEPTGDGIVELTGVGNSTRNYAEVSFFGVGSDGTGLTASMYGYRRIGSLWVPIPIAVVGTFHAASTPGVSGSPIDNTNLFAITITPSTLPLKGGPPSTSYVPFTTSQDITFSNFISNCPASIRFPVGGYQKLAISIDKSAGLNSGATAVGGLTNGNCLVALY